MKIQKLPLEARTKLESGVIISDIAQCVLELVRNSLDADASAVAVRVDLKKFYITVIDNGKGIGKDDLELVGERFMTSKYQTWNNSASSCCTYGYKGQALSSILDFCRSLTIKTKAQNDGPTLVKVFMKSKGGQISEIKDGNFGTGTTVIIEDCMHTMPVRKKRVKEVYDMEDIKIQLQYLALIHYDVRFILVHDSLHSNLIQVRFTLRNESKGLILLQTAQASNMLEIISNLYGKAIAKNLKPVKYEENNYRITGYASVKLSNQNNIQIVYLNRQVISKGMIHKFINNIMKEYNDSKTLLTNSPAEQVLKKLKNSYQTFIIEIKCPRDYYELFTNSRKTSVEFKSWKDVLKCIYKSFKRSYKFDCIALDDSFNHFENDGGKFGTSVLVNAVKGVPATRCYKVKKDIKKQKREVFINASNYENNESSKLPLTDSKEKENDNSLCDTLETPIPKNRKAICSKKSNSTKSHSDISYIEFYKWLKESFKNDANTFNLYSEFLKQKKKPTITCESYKSPVLGVKLKEKRISSMKSEVPEKKPKTTRKGSTILSEEIAVMTKNSFKHFPSVNLRVKKAVQFNTEMSYKMTEFSNFDCENRKKRDEIFKKLLTSNKGGKHSETVHDVFSPASSETHFMNVINFRNVPESFHFGTLPLEEELYTSTWMSHYQDARNDNVVRFSNIAQNVFKRHSKKDLKFRDVKVQTSYLEIPEKVNVMVQTSQTIQELSFSSELNAFINETPIPDFWNSSTSGNHLTSNADFELNKIISPKTHKQIQSFPSEFICSQKLKAHSTPKSTTETQTLPHLWTDSLSEFGNPIGQDSDAKAKTHSIPKTIPLEEIRTPQFCLTERHDFVPKGLSPKYLSSEAVEIPNLDSYEKSRIQLMIDEVNYELLTVKWQDESTGKCAKPAIPNTVGQMQLNAERKSIICETHILSASLSYCSVKVHNLLHSFTLTKEILSSVEVLGQLDKKFIITKMKMSSPKNMELICLLDQHAVDERIKLENIIKDYTKFNKFVSTALKYSVELTLSKSEVQVLIDLGEKMSNFGFDIKPKNQETILVNAIPSFLSDKFEKEVRAQHLMNKKESSLEDLLQTVILNIVSEITKTKGAVSNIPKIMHDAFSSEACHNAIKFNRALSQETMINMISDLKNCKLPFQCAHGRPSVIPIIDLEDFKSEKNEGGVDFQKIKKFYHERNEVELS